MHTGFIPDICQAPEVSRSTYSKYLHMISEDNDMTMRDVNFICSCDKPRKFPLEAGFALIEWIGDPNTVSIELTCRD